MESNSGKKKKSNNNAVSMIVWLCIGGVIGAIIGIKAIEASREDAGNYLVYLILVVVFLYIGIVGRTDRYYGSV